MVERTFESGFCDGWESVAGKEPMPGRITYPPKGDATDYDAGFLYGRAEADMRFKPSSSDHPAPTSS